MLFDTHIHTKMSADSTMEPEEALAAARRLKLSLAFTEHVDFECDSDLNFVTDVNNYLNNYEKLKQVNNNISESKLFLGLEIGMTEGSLENNLTIVSDDRLDIIIGSIHVVNQNDIFTTFFLQDALPEEIYRQYLKYTADMIEKYDCFDSLGHIDYPSRYSPFKEKNIMYHDYQKEYNKIFSILIEKRKSLEINTKRFNLRKVKEHMTEIYQAYYNLGGRYITLGSDAHNVSSIGYSLNEAYHMAISIGLTPVYYENREKQVITNN